MVSDLRRLASAERRAFTSTYFPSSMEILGVGAPVIRSVIRSHASTLRSEPPQRILQVAQALAESGVHEARQAGYEMLSRRVDALRELDLERVERLGQGNDNWASVDAFSVLVAGPCWRIGRITDQDVSAWASSPDRWWRRTALVSTVALNARSRGGAGDVPRTMTVCEILAADREPMVAKALSWALRAAIEHDRGAVIRFLGAHVDDLASLVLREVRSKLETGRKTPPRRSRSPGSAGP